MFFCDDHIQRQLVQVSQQTPVMQVIQEMHQAESSCALIVEAEKIIGIFTEKDVVRAIAKGLPVQEITVGTVMTQPVITVSALDIEDITKIQQKFQQYHIRHLPVIDHQGQILGVMTPADINTQAVELENRKGELQKLEPKFAEILNSAVASAIVSFRVFPNCDWVCDYQSPGSEGIFGYTAEEIMNNPTLWMLGVHPEDREMVIMPLYADIFAGRTVSVEYRFHHKDGSLRWISATYNSRYLEDAQCWVVTGTNFDISDRKQIEESLQQSEQRYRAIFDLTFQFIGLLQPDGTLLEANQTALDFAGLQHSDIVNRPFWEARWWTISPETQEQLKAAIAQAAAGDFVRYQVDVLGVGENITTIEFSLKPIKNDAGEVVLLLPEGKDISEHLAVLRERQQIEQSLRQSEARFQHLVANLPGSIYTFVQSPDGSIHFQYMSSGVEKIYEITAEEIIANPTLFIQATHPGDLPGYTEAVRQSYENLSPFSYQWRIITPSGQLKWVQANSMPELRSNGDVAWHGLGQDITVQQAALQERELAELELIHSRDLREAIFHKSTDALFLVETKTYLITDCNDRAVELFQFTSKDQLIGMDGQTLQKQPFTPEEMGSIVEIINQQGFWSQEIEYCTSQGNCFWGNLAAKEIIVAGEIIHLVRVTDISERKQAELALQEREAMLRGIGDNLHNGMVYQMVRELDGSYNFSYLSAGVETLMEITATDVLQDCNLLCRQFFKEDYLKLQAVIEESAQNLSVFDIQLRIQTPSGRMKWLNFRNSPRWLHDGRLAWDGLAIDVTELKLHEVRLEESQGVSRLGNWEHDLITGKISWSKQLYRLFHRDPAQLEPTYGEILQFYHPEDAAQLHQVIEDAIATGESYKLILRVPQLENSYRYLQIIGHAGCNGTGEVIRLYGTVQDITEQRIALQELQKTQAALAKSEEQLRLTLEFTDIGTWDWNILTNEVIWNNNHYNLLGLDPQTTTPTYQVWRNAIHPEDIEKLEQAVFKTLQGNGNYVYSEYRVIHPDGSIHWLSGRARGIKNAAGEPIRMLGIVMDISDRRRAAQMLELQAVITGNIAEGISLIRYTDGIIVYTNPKFDQMFGYETGELIGQHVSTINYEDQQTQSQAEYQKLAASVNKYGEFTYEIHNIKKDRTEFWCRGTSSIFKHHEYGTVFVAIQQDITRQKQADEKVKASLKEKEVLLQEIHHRVKNNLGIVSSLLQMQCRRTKDDQAKAILRDSQNRIASIALVHEKLYRSEELADIDFAQYIPDLTTHLFDSYNVSSQQIKLNIEVDNASLNIETAIPCGLIINELVSNALKYAFPDQRSGEIKVQFYPALGGKLILIIRDNGVGLPAEFDPKTSKTLGLTLVQGLVKQLRGNLDINSHQGTEFKITFTNI